MWDYTREPLCVLLFQQTVTSESQIQRCHYLNYFYVNIHNFKLMSLAKLEENPGERNATAPDRLWGRHMSPVPGSKEFLSCDWTLTSVKGISLGSWYSTGRKNCPLQEHCLLQRQCSCRSQRLNPAVIWSVVVHHCPCQQCESQIILLPCRVVVCWGPAWPVRPWVCPKSTVRLKSWSDFPPWAPEEQSYAKLIL